MEVLKGKYVMISRCGMARTVGLMRDPLHVISSFQLIKEMLMVNAFMANAFVMVREFSRDLRSAPHYLKLSADQGNLAGQFCYAMCLLTGNCLECDIAATIRHSTLSAENDSLGSQAVIEWMAENGISTAPRVAAAVQYYELSIGHSIAGTLRFGRRYRKGRGVRVDLTVAAEFFQKIATFGDGDCANGFGAA
jgi:TPR repeat protein